MKDKNSICDCLPTDVELVEDAKENMLKDKYILGLSSLFKILGDETRIRIVYTLSNAKMCVGDIAVVLNMTKSAVSHQLSSLKSASLIKSEKIGKNVYYELDDDHVVDILAKALVHVKHKDKE